VNWERICLRTEVGARPKEAKGEVETKMGRERGGGRREILRNERRRAGVEDAGRRGSKLSRQGSGRKAKRGRGA